MASPADESYPLTPEHCATCNKVLADGMRNLAVIEKCKDCGYPVDQQEADQRYLIEQASAIKRNFFPHNP